MPICDLFLIDDLSHTVGGRLGQSLASEFTFVETRNCGKGRPLLSTLPCSLPGMSISLKGIAVGGFLYVTLPTRGVLHDEQLVLCTEEGSVFATKKTTKAGRVPIGTKFTGRSEFNRVHSVGRRLYSSTDGTLEVTPHLSEFKEASRFPGHEIGNSAFSDHATISRVVCRGSKCHALPLKGTICYAVLSKGLRIVVPVTVHMIIPVATELTNTSLGIPFGFLCTVPRSWMGIVMPEWFNDAGRCISTAVVDAMATRDDNCVLQMCWKNFTAKRVNTKHFVCNSDLLGALGHFFFDGGCCGTTRREFKSFMEKSSNERRLLSVLDRPSEFAPVTALGYLVRVRKVEYPHDDELDEF